MSETNIYRCGPRKARQYADRVLKAGLVPFIQGSPGIGKSAIIRDIANQYNWDIIDHRVATSAPEDFSGLPRFDEKGRAHFAPFGDIFPLSDRKLPDDKNGWLLFLDEFNQGKQTVQAAAYKLVLDRSVGQEKLHDNTAIIMAGNLSTDRAITNDLSTAMQSRVIHIELEVNFQDWLLDVALPQQYDERITAFLSWQENYLMDFNPNHSEKTFACPRTWEFVNRLVKDRPIEDSDAGLLSGTITSGIAAEFVQFAQIYKELATVKEIVAAPETINIPNTADKSWAIVSHLINKTTKDNLAEINKYIQRMQLTYRVLYFRGLMATQQNLNTHPAYADALVQLVDYMDTSKD